MTDQDFKIQTLKMIDMQKELNSIIHSEWQSQEFAWNTAIMVEATELIDSIPWKWWKSGQSPDWNNVKVEAVDIFHFLLSALIEFHNNDVKVKNVITISYDNAVMDHDEDHLQFLSKDKDERAIIKKAKQIVLCVLSYDWDLAMKYWWSLWMELGYNNDYLVKEYLTKNTLNLFRQSHGYNTGEYHKIWDGDEDNKVVFKIANQLPLDSDFVDNLETLIEEVYQALETNN